MHFDFAHNDDRGVATDRCDFLRVDEENGLAGPSTPVAFNAGEKTVTVGSETFPYRVFRSYPGSWIYDGVTLCTASALHLLKHLKALGFELDGGYTNRFRKLWEAIAEGLHASHPS